MGSNRRKTRRQRSPICADLNGTTTSTFWGRAPRLFPGTRLPSPGALLPLRIIW